MRIAIAYFSGTGNTAMCVTKMKEVFDERGQECFLLPLERGMPEDLSDFDVLILGYPVHAFNAPEIVLSFDLSQGQKHLCGEDFRGRTLPE